MATSSPNGSETTVSSVYVWGDNKFGQLGTGSKSSAKQDEGYKFRNPSLADEFEALSVTKIAAGGHHTLALDEFGNPWSCGRNKEGQLGLGDRVDRMAPVLITTGELAGHVCKFVSCGASSSAVVTQEGTLFEWGLIHYIPGASTRAQQDGSDRTSNSAPSMAMHGLATAAAGARPVSERLAKLLQDSTMRYLRVSRKSTKSGGGMDDIIPENGPADISSAAIDDFDELDADDVEAGVQSVRTRRRPCMEPLRVRELRRARVNAISFGYGHSLVLTDAGQVFSKGYNDRGQLGIGSRMAFVEYQRVYFTTSSVETNSDRSVAHQRLLRNSNNTTDAEKEEEQDKERASNYDADASTSDDDLRIVSVACGSSHNICLAENGRCFVFGGNSLGQLGLGPGRSDQMLPRCNDLLFDKCGPCKVVACGSNHSAVISANGNLFSWGHSEYGQHGGQVKRGMDLAHGQETKFYHSPREVNPFVAGGPELVSLSCGYLFNLAQDAHGRVWSWGWDSHGALGLGAGKFGQHPQQIESLDAQRVQQITAGHYHAMALCPTQGSRFALSLRPLFVQDAAEATLWATELGEHFDIDIVSESPSWDLSASAGNRTRRSSVGVSRMRKLHKPAKAHRFIVFSRCPKLADMFIKDADEEVLGSRKKTGTPLIKIPGMWEPLVVKSLVQYLYIDQIRDCPPHRLSELSSLAIDLGLSRLAVLASERNAAERRHLGAAVGRVLADIDLRRDDNETETGKEGDDTSDKVKTTTGVPASTFVQDMSRAVNSESLGDVRFALSEPQVDEMELANDVAKSELKKSAAPVHLMHANRVIMTRFPFFMKLLNSGFAESMKVQRGEAVPLTGVSSQTFGTLLQWMYTGDRSGIDESTVVELMEAARLFEIDTLFRICEAYVSERIDLDNAGDLLKVADSVKSQRIERCCKYLLEQASAKV